ncbi:hypothetical protein J6590_001736 [Homalodisca vitripennis]|nr:hypothetical protein J6590_001736 [Homalodisca vitripennis]
MLRFVLSFFVADFLSISLDEHDCRFHESGSQTVSDTRRCIQKECELEPNSTFKLNQPLYITDMVLHNQWILLADDRWRLSPL